MIFFYDKKDGRIIGTIDGRVHSQEQMKMSISDGSKDIGKLIIGFEEKREKGKLLRKSHNPVMFKKMVDFENGESILDYKFKKNKLVKCKLAQSQTPSPQKQSQSLQK